MEEIFIWILKILTSEWVGIFSKISKRKNTETRERSEIPYNGFIITSYQNLTMSISHYPRSTPPKSYSMIKIPRFNLRHLEENPAISKENAIMRQRIERTWPITVSQYRRLWGETPAYGIRTGAYIVEGIRSGMDMSKDMKGVWYKKDLPNMRRLSGGATVLFGEAPGEHSILHAYSNLNLVIDYMRTLKLTPNDILFDGELNIELGSWMRDDPFESFRPDCTILKWNSIIFIETDLWTEVIEVLKEKARMYRKFFDTGLLQEMGYTKIHVVFNSFTKRIQSVHKNKCFEPIKKYLGYSNFLMNPINYLPEYGVSVRSLTDYNAIIRGMRTLKERMVNEDKRDRKGEKLFPDAIEFEKMLFEVVEEIMRLEQQK